MVTGGSVFGVGSDLVEIPRFRLALARRPTLAARCPKLCHTANQRPSMSSMSSHPINACPRADKGISLAIGVARIAQAGEFELP